MKKMLLSFLVMVLAISAFAQSEKQVRWTFQSKKIAEGTYEVRMTADIGGNFHMYSQDGGDGPVSTSFDFTKSPRNRFQQGALSSSRSTYESTMKLTNSFPVEMSVEYPEEGPLVPWRNLSQSNSLCLLDPLLFASPP